MRKCECRSGVCWGTLSYMIILWNCVVSLGKSVLLLLRKIGVCGVCLIMWGNCTFFVVKHGISCYFWVLVVL